MPGFDRTGPAQKGPVTGRGRGSCNAFLTGGNHTVSSNISSAGGYSPAAV